MDWNNDFVRDVYMALDSFFFPWNIYRRKYFEILNTVIVKKKKKNGMFVYVFDRDTSHLWPSTFSNLHPYPSHISSRRRFFPLICYDIYEILVSRSFMDGKIEEQENDVKAWHL